MFKRKQDALYFGVTPLDNVFITEYLPNADGDYVKVYLQVLYHSYCGDEADNAEVARELAMRPEDVERALRYWERMRLLRRVTDNPPSYEVFSLISMVLQGKDSTPQADMAFVSFSEGLYSLFGEKRKVQVGEIAFAYEWVQELGLSQEAVFKLLTHCMRVRGASFSFKTYANKLALEMKTAGVIDERDAEAYLAHSALIQSGARDVLRRLGQRRYPSEDEIKLYEKWLGEWNFTPEAILAACAETTKGAPNFAYLNGVLEGLYKRGAGSTQKQLESHLKSEHEQGRQIKAFLRALGVETTVAGVADIYKDLCANHAPEVVLLAAREAKLTGGKLETVSALLDAWQAKGLSNQDDVRAYIAQVNSANAMLRMLFTMCGHSGRPTPADRANYAQWRQWGMTDELLRCAAEASSGADNKPAYLHAVLKGWHEQNITTPEQAKTARARHAEKGAFKPAKVVSAQQYTQREYTKEELDALDYDIFKEVDGVDGQ